MRRVRVIISGKVQGVFFRYSAQELANKLRIKGFARNRADGTVEVLAEGSESAVNDFVEFCKKGPVMSRVDNAELKEEKFVGNYHKFEIV